MPYSSSKNVFLPLIINNRQGFLISYLDGLRSVKVSSKKVNVALDKELGGHYPFPKEMEIYEYPIPNP
jgi:hypothetical protein